LRIIISLPHNVAQIKYSLVCEASGSRTFRWKLQE